MNLKKELRKLENRGVFIHLSYDHYQDGTNCNFSIEFIKLNQQTGWYGDNHEFGDTADCIETAIRFANWLLEEDHLELYFANPTETQSEEGHKRWMQIRAFKELCDKLLNEDFNNSFKKEKTGLSSLIHMIVPEVIRTIFNKKTYKQISPLLNLLQWSLKLWLLTAAIPLTFTLVWTIIVLFLGAEAQYTYFEGLAKFWSDYYVTGSLFGFASWRWHLAGFFMCVVFTAFNED